MLIFLLLKFSRRANTPIGVVTVANEYFNTKGANALPYYKKINRRERGFRWKGEEIDNMEK